MAADEICYRRVLWSAWPIKPQHEYCRVKRVGKCVGQYVCLCNEWSATSFAWRSQTTQINDVVDEQFRTFRLPSQNASNRLHDGHQSTDQQQNSFETSFFVEKEKQKGKSHQSYDFQWNRSEAIAIKNFAVLCIANVNGNFFIASIRQLYLFIFLMLLHHCRCNWMRHTEGEEMNSMPLCGQSIKKVFLLNQREARKVGNVNAPASVFRHPRSPHDKN